MQEEKGVTENEMIGWHHQLNGYELEQTPRDSEGWGAWHAVVHGVAKSWIRLITEQQQQQIQLREQMWGTGGVLRFCVNS